MTDFYTSVEPYGNSFRVRGIFDGVRDNRIVRGFVPELFVPSNNQKETTQKGVDGVFLEKMNTTSVSSAKDLVEMYSDVVGQNIYGSTNWVSQYITHNYQNKITFDSSKIRVFNVDIEVYTGDFVGFPHPDDAECPVNLIQLIDSFDSGIVKVWGCGEYDAPSDVDYIKCSNEEDLLRRFVEYWEMNIPDVMTGWNIKGFDVPYIMNRVSMILGEETINRFSPWKNVRATNYRNNYGKDAPTYIICGVAVLDYLDLYTKYTYAAQESYKLDHIAHVELGERKIDYSDVGSLFLLCDSDYQRFVDYGVQDTRLVQRIDEKMKLIDLVYTLAYLTKQNYTDTFSPVKSWESLIYNHLYEKDEYTQIKSNHAGEGRRIAGAYVMKPKIGKMKKWVLSFDLDSLYPHLIAQYNIGNETLVPEYAEPNIEFNPCDSTGEQFEYNNMDKLVDRTVDLSTLKDKGMTMTPNGAFFYTAKQSVISELMMGIYSGRKTTKGKMLDIEQQIENMGEDFRNDDPSYFLKLTGDVSALNNEQMALKILLNSGYGALANRYFQFHDSRVAEAITLSGQLSLLWIIKRLNGYFNGLMGTDGEEYVCYGDTDSTYVELGGLVDKVYAGKSPSEEEIVNFLDKVSTEQIEPFIKKCYDELAEYTNAFDNKMRMTREVVASCGFWTAKKRYALMVHDSEGVRYATPKTKVMGLEIVKSSTPERVRASLKGAVETILTTDEDTVIDFIADVKYEFMKMNPEEMGSPRGVNNVEKYFTDEPSFKIGTPKHTRAALSYNRLIKHHGLELDEIVGGDKIKFIDLHLPNPSGCYVIGWPSHLGLPVEFGLHKYIDKTKSYTNTFLTPMETMLHSIGWKSEKQVTLEDFF